MKTIKNDKHTLQNILYTGVNIKNMENEKNHTVDHCVRMSHNKNIYMRMNFVEHGMERSYNKKHGNE